MNSKPKHATSLPASRYWRGKPGAAPAPQSDSDSDDQVQDVKPKIGSVDTARKDGITILQTGLSTVPLLASSSEASDDDDDDIPTDTRRPSTYLPDSVLKPAKVEAANSIESSSEDESSDEEEAKPLYKPVFVSKRNRDPKVQAAAAAEDPEELEMIRQAQLEEERRQAHQLVGDTLKRALAEKQVSETFPDVDDTDGIDTTEEFEAWKLRELQRIKRDADALAARDQEKEEVEKRRAMPEHLRLKEDLEHAAKTRNKPKQQQAFMQKYHHRGVFGSHLQDGDDILNRQFETGTEDAVRDMASLPKMMQVRDYGKRSRTKHTHLVDVDTTDNRAGWGKDALKHQRTAGYEVANSAGSSTTTTGCFNCGEQGHLARDCPNPRVPRTNGDSTHSQRPDHSRDWGANDQVRERLESFDGSADRPRRKSRTPPKSYDRDREQDRGRRHPRSRTRSNSRDRSLERMRAERDKRRRHD